MKLKLGRDAKFRIEIDPQFKKDVKRLKRRKKPLEPLRKVLRILAAGNSLSQKYKDHELSREWKGSRECHIAIDGLLIYQIENNVFYIVRTGSHEELFPPPAN